MFRAGAGTPSSRTFQDGLISVVCERSPIAGPSPAVASVGLGEADLRADLSVFPPGWEPGSVVPPFCPVPAWGSARERCSVPARRWRCRATWVSPGRGLASSSWRGRRACPRRSSPCTPTSATWTASRPPAASAGPWARDPSGAAAGNRGGVPPGRRGDGRRTAGPGRLRVGDRRGQERGRVGRQRFRGPRRGPSGRTPHRRGGSRTRAPGLTARTGTAATRVPADPASNRPSASRFRDSAAFRRGHSGVRQTSYARSTESTAVLPYGGYCPGGS
jgi:hypothetical protein